MKHTVIGLNAVTTADQQQVSIIGDEAPNDNTLCTIQAGSWKYFWHKAVLKESVWLSNRDSAH